MLLEELIGKPNLSFFIEAWVSLGREKLNDQLSLKI